MRNYWNKFMRFIHLSSRDFVDIDDIECEPNDFQPQVGRNEGEEEGMDVIYDCKASIPQNHSLKGSEGVNNFISLIMAFLKTYSK